MKSVGFKYTLMAILVVLFYSCKQGELKIGVKQDAKHWPYPFFGEFIEQEDGYDFLYFNRKQRRLSLYDEENVKKLDFAHTYYISGDYHHQSFVRHNKDSLFILDKNLSDIILFDSKGIIKRHFWFKERVLNHLSSFKNRPVYINGTMYLTVVRDCEDNRPYELAIDIKSGSSSSIQIPFPPDVIFDNNLNQAFITPAKLRVKNTLVYHFPTSNYLVFYRPSDKKVSFKEIKWQRNRLKVPTVLLSKDYQTALKDYKQMEKVIHFSYNKKSQELLFVRQQLNNNWVEIMNQELMSQEAFQLRSSCYIESILPLKGQFLALDYEEKSENKPLSYFKNIQDLKMEP